MINLSHTIYLKLISALFLLSSISCQTKWQRVIKHDNQYDLQPQWPLGRIGKTRCWGAETGTKSPMLKKATPSKSIKFRLIVNSKSFLQQPQFLPLSCSSEQIYHYPNHNQLALPEAGATCELSLLPLTFDVILTARARSSGASWSWLASPSIVPSFLVCFGCSQYCTSNPVFQPATTTWRALLLLQYNTICTRF